MWTMLHSTPYPIFVQTSAAAKGHEKSIQSSNNKEINFDAQQRAQDLWKKFLWVIEVAGLGICQFCEYTAHKEGLTATYWTGTAISAVAILTDGIVHGSFGWIRRLLFNSMHNSLKGQRPITDAARLTAAVQKRSPRFSPKRVDTIAPEIWRTSSVECLWKKDKICGCKIFTGSFKLISGVPHITFSSSQWVSNTKMCRLLSMFLTNNKEPEEHLRLNAFRQSGRFCRL